VNDLVQVLTEALAKPSPVGLNAGGGSSLTATAKLRRAVAPFAWSVVFNRVEAVWRDLII
jgi:hypothetical protein